MKIIVDSSIKDKIKKRKDKLRFKKDFGEYPKKIIIIPKDKKNV